jgi:hypothetical protein
MAKSKDVKKYRHECVDIYKLTMGCEECGYNEYPYNLCFDHKPGFEKSDHVKNGYSKRSSAGGMFRLYSSNHSLEELMIEIKKCRILCHNCHTKYTHSSRNKRSIHNIDKRINSLEELENILKEYESNGQ